ncbi:MAG: hypothetical protein K9H26_11150 [Prolixibacteraceae bacterium]|nr:hypothetical protein [Prolixibacteraceae bacterium]
MKKYILLIFFAFGVFSSYAYSDLLVASANGGLDGGDSDEYWIAGPQGVVNWHMTLDNKSFFGNTNPYSWAQIDLDYGYIVTFELEGTGLIDYPNVNRSCHNYGSTVYYEVYANTEFLALFDYAYAEIAVWW